MRFFYWLKSSVSNLFVPRLTRAPRRKERRPCGFELLERRAVLTASYSASGSEFIIDLNSAGDLQISSTGTGYLFTLANGTSNVWTGTGTASVSGANLTANAASLAAYDTFTIRRSANLPRVQFLNSIGNYTDNFNLSMSNGTIGRAGCITFDGTTTFVNNNSLSIVTDYQVAMLANSNLTMTNGNLSMSINMQATPTVMELSGLMVGQDATIQTNGTGQTTIEARGGNGVCLTYQNKGVAVINGGRIIGGTTGNLSITGYGYNNLTLSATTRMHGQGVFVYSNVTTNGLSTITSRGANVIVTGYGANDITANLMSLTASCITNAGVVVGGPNVTTANAIGGLITSGGNGTVTVTGYGGSLANQPTIDTSQSSNFSKSMGVLVTGGNATITSGGAGNVSVTGFGGGATANSIWGIGVAVYSGNISTGANGSVVVNGTGFMNGTQGQQHGVLLYGSGCVSTGPGTGSTTVIGQGGGTSNLAGSSHGVYLWNGGNITNGGSGNVTVTGTGGLSLSTTNIGVNLSGNTGSNPTITSNGGHVLVTGYGGNGNGTGGTSTYGIQLNVNSKITAGGLGDVTVAGYGGNNNGTQGNSNHGVYLTPGGNNQLPSFITSGGGNVSVLGVGGGGDENSTATRPMACNTGVCIACGSYITGGGTGNVTVTGQGGGRSSGATGTNNYGVYVGDGNRTVFSANDMAYSYIGSSGGQVSVTGSGGGGSGSALNSTSGNNYGVLVEKAGTITSGGDADVSITGTGGNFGNSSSSGGGNHGVIVTGTALPTNAPVAYRSTVTTGGSGNLTIIGTGGGSGTGSVNVGLQVASGALVTAGGANSSVALSGQGGNTTGVQNFGVCITGVSNNFPATVTSNGGNVSITGCGPLATAGTTQHGINVNTNGTVSSGGNGSVTVTGRGGTGDVGISGTGHVGVSLATNASISSGGTGPVIITGYGGGNGARAGNHGVHLSGKAVISGGDTAPVTVNGYGGNANGTGATNAGVYVTGVGSKITSSNGTVQITGMGGQTGTTVSGSGGNYGVYVESGAEVSSTGTAPITVNGTGGGLGNSSGGLNNNHGVMVYTLGTGNSTPKITSAGGPVSVTGTAGSTNSSGNFNHGVIIGAGGLITTTGSGTDISINGTGGGGAHPSYTNHGIYMAGTANVSNYTITANGGDIFLNGTAGPSLGSVGVYACTTSASVIGNPSTPGNLTIVTNSADLATTSGSAIHASPQLTIMSRTAGVAIGLGCTTDPANGPLSISAAEIATFNAPSIQMGNSTTGNVTISAGVTVPTGSNLTLVSNGTGSVLSSTLAATNLTLGAGKTLDVSTLPVIGTTINGTTLGTGYSQLQVIGDLSIAGKTLSLSGSYTPAAGNVFTVVEATNLTGTFTGLADGATTTFNGRTLIVNYTSTSVTLTEPSPVVTSNPTSSTVTAGSTATFSAIASGIATPTVQWQVSTNAGSSWTDIAGATNTTYSFTAASGDNANQYRAVFTNTYGTATSAAATLTVELAPSVTTNPSDTTVAAGATASFTAAASGSPTPTVKWQLSTNGGTNWSDIVGATSTTYSLSAASGDNGNQYRAVFTNGVGSDATTSAATLTVTSDSVAPAVTGNPADTTVTAGSTASFTASASGNPAPTVKWQLSTNGGTNWSDIAGATSTTYSFTAASGDNANQYRAIFTNGFGSDATTSAATLTVQYAPTITSDNAVTFATGMNESFQVVATGNPAATYTITGGSLPSGVTLDPTTGALSGKAALGTAGAYPLTISADNGVGTAATQAFTLTVVNQLSNIQVSKGRIQRSYLRYIDLAMSSNAVATELASNASTRMKLIKRDLNGNNPQEMPLTGLVAASDSAVTIDFGASGIGGARNTNAADGYYTLELDMDSDGTLETTFNFYRLFGDTNGDGKVDQDDVNNVAAGMTAYSAEFDLNSDGRVNAADLLYVRRALNRSVNSSLPLGF